ncbi:MAG: hypothetical protein ACLUKN_07160 [Bacilli bacterium]
MRQLKTAHTSFCGERRLRACRMLGLRGLSRVSRAPHASAAAKGL